MTDSKLTPETDLILIVTMAFLGPKLRKSCLRCPTPDVAFWLMSCPTCSFTRLGEVRLSALRLVPDMHQPQRIHLLDESVGESFGVCFILFCFLAHAAQVGLRLAV